MTQIAGRTYNLLMDVDKNHNYLNFDERMKFNTLYDFYSSLLTARQRKIYEMVCFSDLTLAECADVLKISRQAVYIMKLRVEARLERFERELSFVAATRKLEARIKELEAEIEILKRSGR